MIRYYDIEGCEIEIINNVRVLMAPANTPRYLLLPHKFLQAKDGRWMHIVTPEEFQFLMGEGKGEVLAGDTLPETKESKKRAKQFGIAGILALILSILLMALATFYEMGLWLVWVLAAALLIASFGIMMTLRIRYKNSMFGKLLMWIFAGLAVSAVAVTIFIISMITAITD